MFIYARSEQCDLGPVCMSRASLDTGAGPLRRDDFQPGFILE